MEGFFVASVFIGIPWVLGSVYRTHLAHQRYMRLLQLKADMSARMLDRLGAEPNVLEFLKSEAPQQMFDVKLAELTPRVPTPYARMLTAIQIGIVMLCGGGAFPTSGSTCRCTRRKSCSSSARSAWRSASARFSRRRRRS